MSENRDSRITDAMRTAAGHAVARRFRASEHGQLCPYWVAHKRNAPTDLAECNCWILRNAQVYADVALDAAAQIEAATVPLVTLESAPPGPTAVAAQCPDCGPGYRIGDEGCRHGTSPVIASWPQWWCPACGNRYAVAYDLCSCEGRLQAVTLQLVAREAS